MSKPHLEFCVAVHRALTGDRSLCWSPCSVAAALAMAAAGARGATRQELLDVLGAASPPAIQPGPAAEFAVFNTLFAGEELDIADGFAAQLAELNGSVRPAPFGTDPAGARELINSSVAETTHGLINHLVPPGAVGTDTVAALVNALYLKASWLSPFADAVDAPFHAPDSVRQVPTMRVQARFGYAEQDGWQVVSLPAAGGVQAVVLLPDDLTTAESDVDADLLARLLDAPRTTEVDLWLPKLRVRLDASLRETIAAAGAPTMFTREADFTGISSRPVHISDLLHGSVLRVDEGGLEGAAATAGMVALTSAPVQPPTPVEVRVDRPFLFLVRHSDSAAVYFLARVLDPGR
jgi:serpin B